MTAPPSRDPDAEVTAEPAPIAAQTESSPAPQLVGDAGDSDARAGGSESSSSADGPGTSHSATPGGSNGAADTGDRPGTRRRSITAPMLGFASEFSDSPVPPDDLRAPARIPIRFGNLPCDAVTAHPRVVQQDLLGLVDAKSAEGHARVITAIQELVQGLRPFGNHSYDRVFCFIDWDHALPSELVVLRVVASYGRARSETAAGTIERISAKIVEDNLYPEFDLPDFGELQGDESYTLAMKILRDEHGHAIGLDPQIPRFASPWRRDVERGVAERVVSRLQKYPDFMERDANPPNEQVRGALVAGWAAPVVANTPNWALEVWQVTEFDGHAGRARVYMVDSIELELGLEYDTDIQASG